MSIRARVQIAKGKLREYEGRLRVIEGHLTALRGRAERTTGAARIRIMQAEKKMRGALEIGVNQLESAVHALEPRLKRALRETRAVSRGVRAGVKTGAETYRRSKRT